MVFDVALAVRPIRKMHSICSSLRVLWTKFWREAFKADKNPRSSLASSDVMIRMMMIRRHDQHDDDQDHDGWEFISSRDFFYRKSHGHKGNQSWLGSKYLLVSWPMREKSRFWTSNRRIAKCWCFRGTQLCIRIVIPFSLVVAFSPIIAEQLLLLQDSLVWVVTCFSEAQSRCWWCIIFLSSVREQIKTDVDMQKWKNRVNFPHKTKRRR